MKKTRRRKNGGGYVYKQGSSWHLRYYDQHSTAEGLAERVQRYRKLADCEDCGTRAAAQKLADEFLQSLKERTVTIESTMSLADFVERSYLPYVKTHKRKSTSQGYGNLWSRYLGTRCDVALRDFGPVIGQRVLQEIAETSAVNRTTLQHIKHFLSGVFSYALRMEILKHANPMKVVQLPNVRPAGDTRAYSLEEVLQMLKVLPEPAATVVATAAFTGARRGELRGLLWDNYDGLQIRITQSVWRSHFDDPKTKQSRAPVPVIAQLAHRLTLHRQLAGNPAQGLIFRSAAGLPLNLDALARDVIAPTLKKAGIEWCGWHAFRRGVATNLHRLGVQDKVIQAVLRHANVAVTQACYIKTSDADTTAAMRALQNATDMQVELSKNSQIM